MKRFLKLPIIAITLLLFGAVQNKTSAQVSVSVSFQTFYDELSPYGQWINYPEYGYVWSPDDRYRDFHPYQSDGHWAWSEALNPNPTPKAICAVLKSSLTFKCVASLPLSSALINTPTCGPASR